MPWVSTAVEKSWYKPVGWTLLLIPLAWLFQWLVGFRLKQKRTTAQANFKTPIIVVGNITVGGAGKTPLIIALVKCLQLQGIKPGVISRGYGGQSGVYPLSVTPESDPAAVGDEPLLIAQHCPVVVSPDRFEAARFLVDKTDCNLILSDDGLQHYRLPRDMEIIVVDGTRGFGNGYCLPAGPLREPADRLDSADMVVINGENSGVKTKRPLYQSHIKPVGFRALADSRLVELHELPGGTVHAVAGIGNPQRFVDSLVQLGFQPQLHAYSDHHKFTGKELLFDDDLPVLITAKDAVKLKGLPILTDNIWILDIEVVLETEFQTIFCEKIAHLLTVK